MGKSPQFFIAASWAGVSLGLDTIGCLSDPAMAMEVRPTSAVECGDSVAPVREHAPVSERATAATRSLLKAVDVDLDPLPTVTVEH